ncbi:MAG: hypothetical protein KDE31_31420, partial [Caldilineaceae bacterium]|nr:hypothetical protein [Caldilineaceae bacterium]
MELANPIFNNALMRPLRRADNAELTWFLRNARYTHVHVDWYTLADWLDQPGAVGMEIEGALVGFLVAGADPLPASWLRGVAFIGEWPPGTMLERLLGAVVPA